MRSPEDLWPTWDNLSSPPQEERRKELAIVKAANVQVVEEKIDWRAKSDDLKKVVRLLAVVIAVVKKWIGYKVSAVKVSGCCPVEVTKEHLDLAENLLISQVQSELKKGTFDSLMPEIVKMKGVVKGELKIIQVGGRQKNRFRVGYDVSRIPVLPYGHPLSQLHLLSCHGAGH